LIKFQDSTGDIKASCFNETAEKMSQIFQENKVYFVSMVSVSFATNHVKLGELAKINHFFLVSFFSICKTSFDNKGIARSSINFRIPANVRLGFGHSMSVFISACRKDSNASFLVLATIIYYGRR